MKKRSSRVRSILRCPERWLFILLLTSRSILAGAQSITVGYRKTVNVTVPGALAAFSLNDLYAEANAEAGTMTVFGKNPGAAHIVVVTREGSKTFEVRILPPPTSYPPGFVPPQSVAAARESGSYESRFTSNPSAWSNIVDFMRHEGDRTVTFHLAGTFAFTPLAEQRIFALSSMFYEIQTPVRDITLLDQLMSNSPLTVDGSIVRGIHLRQNDFFFHAGYTSASTFENLIFPSQKEGVAGAGYRFSAGRHASLTPNFYFFPGTQCLGNPVPRGTVASLVYDYEPGRNLGLLAEAGFSHGLGAAGQFHSYSAHNQLTAKLRYEPINFAAVSLTNLHGLYSNLDLSHDFMSHLAATFSFTGNHYKLPSLNMVDMVANLNLRFKLSRHWSLLSGITYGLSESHVPLAPAISTHGVPIGINFDSGHFQSGFLYQYSRNSGNISRSNEFRTTLGTHWGGFHWSGYADRQSQAITIAFSAAGIAGLQDRLDELGLSATTPQQVALALSETAGLLNQNLIQGININVNPVRTQAGSDLMWSNHAHSRQRFDFSLLYNKNQTPLGDNRAVIGAFSHSLKFKTVNELFSSISLLRDGNHPRQSAPLFEISIRRQVGSAPNFIIARRRGTISGVVFADDGASGAYHPGGILLPGVEVVLDDTRRSRTDQGGRYVFSRVSYGSHTVEVIYRSAAPFFLTTPSRVPSEIDTEVNFGVGLSFARLFGYVRSDVGIGLPGIELSITKGAEQFHARTDAEGKFRVEGLSSGQYEIKIDTGSVPPGYSLAGLETQRTTVNPSVPTRSTFELKVIRNISGRVTIYDRTSQQQIPVPGIVVALRQILRECVTDKNGLYLFRDLPPGLYSLVVAYQGKESKREVTLPDGPTFLKSVDIALSSN